VALTLSAHPLTRDNLELKAEKIPSLSFGRGNLTNKRAIVQRK